MGMRNVGMLVTGYCNITGRPGVEQCRKCVKAFKSRTLDGRFRVVRCGITNEVMIKE